MRTALCASLLLSLSAGCNLRSPVRYWLVDPLVKIFPDSPPGFGAPRSGQPLLIPRNGHASLQVAVRSSERIPQFNVSLLAPASGAVSLGAIVRRVGYVPVGSNPPATPDDELLRPAPALFPDPLFDDFPFPLEADTTTSLWITVRAPSDAPPGEYKGRLDLRAGAQSLHSVDLNLRVAAATVPPSQTLKVTNWIYADRDRLALLYKFSSDDDYWKLLENLGRVLADHRQNVILTPVLSLTTARLEGRSFRYDFSHLDRWIETFTRAGLIGTIEGGHLLSRASGYHSSLVVPSFIFEAGQVVLRPLPPDDPRAELHLNLFLPALYAHLKQRGWADRYIQHIHDEPHGPEAAAYTRFAQIIRRHLPGIPTIDAVSLQQDISFFADVVDIWVPVLGSFDRQLERIRSHTGRGGQAWFYTCISPQGRHLNRFIDYPLLKTRLLHWLNFRHGFTGFLHWGGNYWGPKPFDNVQPVINDNRTLLPAGDHAIVYPDPSRLSVLSSIRLEAMREGIEDYELLARMARTNPDRARRLAAAAIPHTTDYVRDIDAFRRLHRELLE